MRTTALLLCVSVSGEEQDGQSAVSSHPLIIACCGRPAPIFPKRRSTRKDTVLPAHGLLGDAGLPLVRDCGHCREEKGKVWASQRKQWVWHFYA